MTDSNIVSITQRGGQPLGADAPQSAHDVTQAIFTVKVDGIDGPLSCDISPVEGGARIVLTSTETGESRAVTVPSSFIKPAAETHAALAAQSQENIRGTTREIYVDENAQFDATSRTLSQTLAEQGVHVSADMARGLTSATMAVMSSVVSERVNPDATTAAGIVR